MKAIACARPRQLRLPLARLQVPDIHAEAIRQGLVAQISGTTIWRWLAEDALRPWAHRSWIFPRDPDFARKAAVVLDRYARRYQGQRLGLHEYVLCADEKTSIQARVRRHASAPARPGRPVRVEHEYRRGGAVAYLAAYDVHRAKLFGRIEPTTGIAPFGRLVDQVMSTEPYRSARRVFLVVDNGSSHRGAAAARRLAALPKAPAHPLAGARQLARPDRDLLLDRPAHGPHAERLPVGGRDRATRPRLPGAL